MTPVLYSTVFNVHQHFLWKKCILSSLLEHFGICVPSVLGSRLWSPASAVDLTYFSVTDGYGELNHRSWKVQVTATFHQCKACSIKIKGLKKSHKDIYILSSLCFP